MTGEPSDQAGRTEPPPSAQFNIRQLRRSTSDRMIGGVCGGLGQYTGLDPVIFRITLGVLAVFGGAGLVLYAIAWFVVPDDTSTQSEAQRVLRGRGTLLTVFAVGIAILGVLTLADLVRRGWPGPATALLIGAALVALVVYRRGWSWSVAPPARSPAGSPPQPHGAAADPAHTGGGFFGPETSAFAPPSTGGASAPLGPPAGFAPSRPPFTPPQFTPPPFTPPPFTRPFTPPPRPPRQPSLLAPIAVCAGIVAAGVLLALGASHALDVTAQAVFATALLVVGAALVVGTWIGRGRGLIAVGAVLTVCLVVAAILDVPLRGGIGTRFDTPTTTANLRSAYHLAIGREILDLSAVPLDGRVRHVDVTVGVGELRVVAPANAKVVVHATTGTGRIELPGTQVNGTHLSRDATYATAGPQTGEIDLDLHVGAGSLEVDRSFQGAQP